MRFLRVSFGLPVPEPGKTGVIPATAPLYQLNVVPETELSGMYLNVVLLHMSDKVRGVVSTGVGFTVMVNVRAGPGQRTDPLLNVGVTISVAVIGTVPVLVAVNVIVSELPPDPSPISVLLFDQE